MNFDESVRDHLEIAQKFRFSHDFEAYLPTLFESLLSSIVFYIFSSYIFSAVPVFL